MQYFHRDPDDFRFLTLFIYLTDVSPSAGPHQVIPGSHFLAGMTEILIRKASWRRSKMDAAATFVDDIGYRSSPASANVCSEKLALISRVMPARCFWLTPLLSTGLGAGSESALSSYGHDMVWERIPHSADLVNVALSVDGRVPPDIADTPRHRHCNRPWLDFDRSYKDGLNQIASQGR